MFNQVSIIGCGLIGSSVLRCLKKNKSVKKIVSFVSEYMTLLPGDVIMTGTPPGVGAGMKPPQFLQVGDEMRLGIEGLGEQRQTVVARN